MTNLETFNRLRRVCADLVQTAQVDLDKFKAKLDENPAYALTWAGQAYQAAADWQVGSEILAAMGPDESLRIARTEEATGKFIDDVVRHLTSEALRAARYPERSTSPWSNEMAREIAASKARLLERLQSW